MTRATRSYSERSGSVAPAPGFDVDTPIAGHYRFRLRKGGHPVGVEIRYGPPLDPIDGTELDRSWRYTAYVNGEPVELERVWPNCAHEPIDKAEHDHLMALQAWGKEHDPTGAQARPDRPIDIMKAAVPF